MIGFLTFFALVVFLFAVLLVEIMRVEKLAIEEGYGPKNEITGPVIAQGQMNCVNEDAPTLHRSVSFPYQFSMKSQRGDVSAKYEYFGKKSKAIDPIYSGKLFLRFRNGRVKGRKRMDGFRTIEGTLKPNKAELTLGYPKKSLLSFLPGSFSYSVDDAGNVSFDNTSHYGSISNKSRLRIHGNRIAGHVIHGPQTTWAVEVDITFDGVLPEYALLAVILACNNIVSFHHE